MARPAIDALNKILADDPGATVTARTERGITVTLSDGRKRTISGLTRFHFDDGGALQPVDTAWLADTAEGFEFAMQLAPYHARAKTVFNSGNIVRYETPAGDSVLFSPIDLVWRDANGSVSFISSPQASTVAVVDDKLTWSEAYGPGRHFEWRADPERLRKLLTIDAATDLPNTPGWMAVPVGLDLSFAFTPSTGIEMYVDGVLVDAPGIHLTTEPIEFRKGGELLWAFMPPTAWDSAAEPNEVAGELRVEWQSYETRYVSVRVPKSWLDTATFPVFIDPTINEQVGVGSDDGYVSASGTFSTIGDIYIDWSSAGTRSFFRFPGVTIPAGSTIDSAQLGLHPQNNVANDVNIATHLNDEDDATAPTSASQLNGKTLTTASVQFAPPTWNTSDGYHYTPDMSSVVQEVIDRAGWASGNALMAIGVGPGDGFTRAESYDNAPSLAATLDVTYTEGGASTTGVVDGTLGTATTTGLNATITGALSGQIDATLGTLSITGQTATVTGIQTIDVPLEGTVTDPDGTVTTLEYRYQKDAGGYGAWEAITIPTPPDTAWSTTILDLGVGSYDVQVRAIDDDALTTTITRTFSVVE